MTVPNGEQAAEVLATIPELELIEDAELRSKVVAAWIRAWEMCGVERLDQAIKLAKPVDDPSIGVLHVRSVIRLTTEAARTLRDVYGVEINVDYVAAGAALHDVCKPVEYTAKHPGTPRGDYVHHAITGAAIALEVGLPIEIVHIVAYHSHFGDSVDRSLEGHLVHALDDLSFDAMIRKHSGLSMRQFIAAHH
ncbi:MAG: HD domain-containing protein [Chloroflexi bacterium]|nr:HD domain-containing protein [Chloroflexota bacterium]